MLPSVKRSNLGLPAIGLFLPHQNGVGEGASLPTTTTTTTSTMDARNANVNPYSNHHRHQQRPKDLVVKNEHLNKALREGDYDHRDHEGSLPCTPEFQSDNEMETSACDEALESDTRQLLSDFLQLHTGIITQHGWRQDTPALSTMKRVVEGLLEKHRYAYNGMINKLSVDDRGDDVTFISGVAQSLFDDKTTNWGRVASLIAFGAVVCQYFKTKGRESCVERVAQEISTYLLTDQRDWLIRNNAWEGFVDFFREHDPESKVRNTLMAFAGIAGIGATLAMLIR